MASACSDLNTEYPDASAAPLSAAFSPFFGAEPLLQARNIALAQFPDLAPTSHVTNNHDVLCKLIGLLKTRMLTQQNQEIIPTLTILSSSACGGCGLGTRLEWAC